MTIDVDAGAVGRVAPMVTLRAVSPSEIIARSHGDDDGRELQLEHRFKGTFVSNLENTVTYAVHYEARVHDPDSDDVALLNVTANYRVSYEISGRASQADLEAFAQNAVHNSWPYWRELLSSTMGRMGFTPFVLPTLQVRMRTPAARAQVEMKLRAHAEAEVTRAVAAVDSTPTAGDAGDPR